MARIYCLFLCFFAFLPTLVAQNLAFTIYGVEDGLPQSGVYDLLQDQSGKLWVATEGGGVAQFDGSRFKTWNIDSGLSDDLVRCLYEDQKGAIYCGTQNNGVSIIYKNQVTYIDSSMGLPHPHVRGILQDKDSRLLVATLGGGIWIGEGENYEVLSAENGLPHDKVRALVETKNGDIWIGTDDGLCLMSQDSLITYKLDSGLPNTKILTLFEDDFGTLWVGTQNGVCFLEHGRFVSASSDALNGERIKSIAQSGEGNYWFGTSNGIYQMSVADMSEDEWPLTFIDKSTGLSNERIRKLLRGRNNEMWVGTYFGGVCRLTDQSFSYFTSDDGFPEDNVTALHLDRNNSMWIGTFDGTIYLEIDGNVSRLYSSESDEADDAIRHFSELPNGEILVGTSASGILHFVNGNFTRKSTDYGDYVFDISHIKDRVAICSEKGFFSKNFAIPAQLKKGLQNSRLTHWQNPDTLFVGTTTGLIRLADTNGDGIFENLKKIEGTEESSITSITEDSSGNLWLGTTRHGIFRVRGTKGKRFMNSGYLESFNVKFILLDEFENLWVGTPKGIDVLELDPSQTLILSSDHFDSDNGFFGVETNQRCALKAKDGSLWFGTIRGITRYSSDYQYINPEPPLTQLSKIELFFEDVDWSNFDVNWEGLKSVPDFCTFGPEQNHLTFHFQGIDLSAPDAVKYQYKLEGQGADWSPTTTTQFITFNNLNPGEYEFQVRARNSQGIWNDTPTTFAFLVQKPLHQETWFQVVAGLILLVLVWIFVRIRLSILEREKRNLEQKVLERTAELNDQKQRSDKLLLNILPVETAEELKVNGYAKTRHYDSVSVLFSDFKGFTKLSESLDAEILVKSLDDCFRAFDRITTKYGVEKIKTIGDAYMCATGLPASDSKHAERMVSFAMEMRVMLEEINRKNAQSGLPVWPIRIGIHSGPVIAGVVGEKKFAYDIWGDTVNIAARMESSGEVAQINISEATHKLVSHKFKCSPRGEVKAKNKGSLLMFYVDSTIEEYSNENIH